MSHDSTSDYIHHEKCSLGVVSQCMNQFDPATCQMQVCLTRPVVARCVPWQGVTVPSTLVNIVLELAYKGQKAV